MTLSTQKIVISGLLGALAILLAVTRIGFIPVPGPTANATILHIPVILGAVLEGPVVGLIVGAIFGIFSWLNAEIPLFADPLVSVVPRLFIGPFAYLAFAAVRRRNVRAALAVAGVVGTLTNTVLVLTMGYLRRYLPIPAIVATIPQAIMEVILAVILVVAVGLAVQRAGLSLRGVGSARPAPRTR